MLENLTICLWLVDLNLLWKPKRVFPSHFNPLMSLYVDADARHKLGPSAQARWHVYCHMQHHMERDACPAEIWAPWPLKRSLLTAHEAKEAELWKTRRLAVCQAETGGNDSAVRRQLEVWSEEQSNDSVSFRQIMMPALLIKTHFIPIMMRDKTANEANNYLPLHRGFLLRVCAIKALLQLRLIYFGLTGRMSCILNMGYLTTKTTFK